MDKVVQKVVALGVPGLVLVVAIAMSGLAGGAAIVAALAALGGPLGMLGGIGVLGVCALVSDALAEYGLEALASAVVQGLVDKGVSKKEIRKQVNSYPLSKGLKEKVLAQI